MAHIYVAEPFKLDFLLKVTCKLFSNEGFYIYSRNSINSTQWATYCNRIGPKTNIVGQDKLLLKGKFAFEAYGHFACSKLINMQKDSIRLEIDKVHTKQQAATYLSHLSTGKQKCHTLAFLLGKSHIGYIQFQRNKTAAELLA